MHCGHDRTAGEQLEHKPAHSARQIRRESAVPVVVFCVAYGEDADLEMLRSMAEPTGGQVSRRIRNDPATLQDTVFVL